MSKPCSMLLNESHFGHCCECGTTQAGAYHKTGEIRRCTPCWYEHKRALGFASSQYRLDAEIVYES